MLRPQRTSRFRRNLLPAVVSLALGAMAASAQAATQSYSFEGSLNAVSFAGTFGFDDSLLSVFDASEPLLTVAPVASLSMSYGGTSYSLANAWAAPDVSYYDGAFLGLSYSNAAMIFVPGSLDVSDAFVTDGLAGADVVYAPVPEPEAYASLGIDTDAAGPQSSRNLVLVKNRNCAVLMTPAYCPPPAFWSTSVSHQPGSAIVPRQPAVPQAQA